MKIPLSQHLQTLENRDELVGLKVWDSITGKYLYVQDAGLDLYCGENFNDFIGDYYQISRLSIDLTEQEK